MPPKYDILAIGGYTVDLIFTGLPGLPEMGKEVIGTGFEMIPGEAYNSVVAMHRLGLKVAWAADFGNDFFSQYTLEQARKEGVDEACFVHHKRPLRRLSVSASFPEDRSFITYYDPDPSLPAALKALASCSAQALYVPGFYYGSLFDAGKQLVRLKHMKLIMDANAGTQEISLQNRSILRAVRSLDLLLPNAREARMLTGLPDVEQAAWALAKLCPLVVIKDGARGSLACDGQRLVHAPALQLQPVDTTGAGDSYNAGFIKAWLEGKPLEECLAWGNIVGGLSTLAHGATGRVIRPGEVEARLDELASQGSKSSG